MTIEELLTDWAAFETLIASVCAAGGVTVEHDVFLKGKSGALRQIDVALRSTQGLISHLVIVECKHWKRRVTRLHVDSMVASVGDLKASKGVIFSTQGFQKGAITVAKHHGIELFHVRDLNASELFGPNTPLDSYRHFLWRTIRNLEFPEIHSWEKDLSNTNVTITLGGKRQSCTPSLNYGTLEETLDSWTGYAATEMALYCKAILFNGAGGVRRYWRNVNQTADPSIQIRVDGSIAVIPKIKYDLGITLWQEHREIQRHDNGFMLAVEDCIRGVIRKASRARGDEATVITPTIEPPEQSENPLEHPQAIILMPEWVKFNFAQMEKGKFYDERGSPSFVPK